MAISHVATEFNSNAAGGTASSLVVDVPTGTQNNHVMIACVYKALDSVHTLTAPSGWTQISTSRNANANIQASVWYRVASSEPASYTWQVSAAGIWGVSQSTFSGVSTSSPIHASASSATTTADPYSCPNVTTTISTNIVSFGATRVGSTTEATHTATDTELADWGFDGGASTRNGAVYFSALKSSGTVTGLSINPSAAPTDACQWSIALTPTVEPSGSFAATLPAVTSTFAATRQIPEGPIAATLPKITSSFAGQHFQDGEGFVDTTLPLVTSSFAGTSDSGGIAEITLPLVETTWGGGVEPIGDFASTLPMMTVSFISETRPFGENIIVVEAEKRAFRVIDDDPGLIPIYPDEVTNA